MSATETSGNGTKMPIGALLIQEGLISEETLEKALKRQRELRAKNKHVEIGKILVKSQCVTEAQIQNAVKKKQSKLARTQVYKFRAEVDEVYGEINKITRNTKTGENFVNDNDSDSILVGETGNRTPVIVMVDSAKIPINTIIRLKKAAAEMYRDNLSDDAQVPIVRVSDDLFAIFRGSAPDISQSVDQKDQTDSEKEFRDLLYLAYESKAVDLHFFRDTNVCRVRFRVWGSLRTHEEWAPEKADDILSVAFSGFGKGAKYTHWKPNIRQRVRIKMQYDNFITLDCRYEHAPGDDGAYHACIRILANDKREVTRQIDLRSLGFTAAQADDLYSAGSSASGMVILSGPTGSGKSTTLSGLVKYLNRDDDVNILTVESPIERELPAFQTSVSDDDDADPREFAQSIKSTLRRDPDILMVGELRDEMSASAAATGVQTGHTLLTTVHAQSAIEIVERLSSPAMKLPPETIGSPSFLSLLVFQMLLPTLDPESKIPLNSENLEEHLPKEQAERLLTLIPDIDSCNLHVRGTSQRYPEGVSGMTICAETVVPDEVMRNLFRTLDLTEALTYWRNKGRETEAGLPLEQRSKGLTAAAHGFFKMKAGLIDPRDLEKAFGRLDKLKEDVQ